MSESEEESEGPLYEFPLAFFTESQEEDVSIYDVPWPNEFPTKVAPSPMDRYNSSDPADADQTMEDAPSRHISSPVRRRLYEHGGICPIDCSKSNVNPSHTVTSDVVWRAWHNEIMLMEVPERGSLRQNKIILRFPVDVLARSVHVRVEKYEGSNFLFVSVVTVVATVHHFGFEMPEEQATNGTEGGLSMFTPYADEDQNRPLHPSSNCLVYAGAALSTKNEPPLSSSFFSWTAQEANGQTRVTSAAFRDTFVILGFEDGSVHTLYSDEGKALYCVSQDCLHQKRLHTSKSMLETVLSAFSGSSQTVGERAVLDFQFVSPTRSSKSGQESNRWVLSVHKDGTVLLWDILKVNCRYAWDLFELAGVDLSQEQQVYAADIFTDYAGNDRSVFILRISHGGFDVTSSALTDSHFVFELDGPLSRSKLPEVRAEEFSPASLNGNADDCTWASDSMYMKQLVCVDSEENTNACWQCWNHENKPGVAFKYCRRENKRITEEIPLSLHYDVLDMVHSETFGLTELGYKSEEWMVKAVTEAADRAKSNRDMIFDVDYDYSIQHFGDNWSSDRVSDFTTSSIFDADPPNLVHDPNKLLTQENSQKTPHEDAQTAVLKSIGCLDSHCLRLLCGNEGYMAHDFLYGDIARGSSGTVLVTVIATRLENAVGDIELPALYEGGERMTLFEWTAAELNCSIDALEHELVLSPALQHACWDFPKAHLLFCVMRTIQDLAINRSGFVRKASGFVPIQSVENARQFFSMHFKAWQYFLKQFYGMVESLLEPLSIYSRTRPNATARGAVVVRREGLFVIRPLHLKALCPPERYLRMTKCRSTPMDAIQGDRTLLLHWAASAIFSLLPVNVQSHLLQGGGNEYSFGQLLESTAASFDSLVANASSNAAMYSQTNRDDRDYELVLEERSSIADILWKEGSIAPSAAEKWEGETIVRLTALQWSGFLTYDRSVGERFTQLEAFEELLDLCYNRQSMAIAENLVAQRSGETRGLHSAEHAMHQPSFLFTLLGYKARSYAVSVLLMVQRLLREYTEDATKQPLLLESLWDISLSLVRQEHRYPALQPYQSTSLQENCNAIKNAIVAFGKENASIGVKLSLLCALLEQNAWFCRNPVEAQRLGEHEFFSGNDTTRNVMIGLRAAPTELERQCLNPVIYSGEEPDIHIPVSRTFSELLHALSATPDGAEQSAVASVWRGSWTWIIIMKLSALCLNVSDSYQKRALLDNLRVLCSHMTRMPWEIIPSLGLDGWISHETILFPSWKRYFRLAHVEQKPMLCAFEQVCSDLSPVQGSLVACTETAEVYGSPKRSLVADVSQLFPSLSGDLLDSDVLSTTRPVAIDLSCEHGQLRLNARRSLLECFIKLLRGEDQLSLSSAVEYSSRFLYENLGCRSYSNETPVSSIPHWDRLPSIASMALVTGQFHAISQLFPSIEDFYCFSRTADATRQLRIAKCLSELHSARSLYHHSHPLKSSRSARYALRHLQDAKPLHVPRGSESEPQLHLTFGKMGFACFCTMAASLLKKHRSSVGCEKHGTNNGYWPDDIHQGPLEFASLALKELEELLQNASSDDLEGGVPHYEALDIYSRVVHIEIEELQWLERYTEALHSCKKLSMAHYRRDAVHTLVFGLVEDGRWDIVASLPFELESMVWAIEYLSRKASYRFFSKAELRNIDSKDLRDLKETFLHLYSLMMKFELVKESRHILWEYCSLLLRAHETLSVRVSSWSSHQIEVAILMRVLLQEGLTLLLGALEMGSETDQWVSVDPSSQAASLSILMTWQANVDQKNFHDPISSAYDIFETDNASFRKETSLNDTFGGQSSLFNPRRQSTSPIRTKFDLLCLHSLVTNELSCLHAHKVTGDITGVSSTSDTLLKSVCISLWASGHTEGVADFVPLQKTLMRQGQYMRSLQLALFGEIPKQRFEKLLQERQDSIVFPDLEMFNSFHKYNSMLTVSSLSPRDVVDKLATACASLHGSNLSVSKKMYDSLTQHGLLMDLGQTATTDSSWGILWNKLREALYILSKVYHEYPSIYDTAIGAVFSHDSAMEPPAWLIKEAKQYATEKGDPSRLLQTFMKFGHVRLSLDFAHELVKRATTRLENAWHTEDYEAPDYVPYWLLTKLIYGVAEARDLDDTLLKKASDLKENLENYATLIMKTEILSEQAHGTEPASEDTSDETVNRQRIAHTVHSRDVQRQQELARQTRDMMGTNTSTATGDDSMMELDYDDDEDAYGDDPILD
eukprot:gb/GECG01004929.1/.p1 GENE.gb/GECG01004929.1/~~gb/GECG01004929.1/.p1  ORF type:complete len:2229 (+),score=253.10 gb/GECG01004929.1/:1-6687(+)